MNLKCQIFHNYIKTRNDACVCAHVFNAKVTNRKGCIYLDNLACFIFLFYHLLTINFHKLPKFFLTVGRASF